MPSKPAQDIWYELWEEAGSRRLDTWHMLSGMDSARNSDHLRVPVGTKMRVKPRAVDLGSFVRCVHQGLTDTPTLLRADDGDHLTLAVATSWVSRLTERLPSLATKSGRT